MKVLQTIAGFGALYGGIATCTYDLISAMHDIGFPLDLLTLEVKNSADKLMGKGEDWIKALPNDAVTPYEYSKRIAQYLKSHDYDLYHTNGVDVLQPRNLLCGSASPPSHISSPPTGCFIPMRSIAHIGKNGR